jgi:tetratricopeptide (TPR) repeat protein
MQAHTQEAAEEFTAELDNDPAHTQAMLYLADADIQMNKLVEAQPLLEKAVKDNPASDMGHRDLGIVYAGTGNQPGAMAQFKRAIAIKPDDVNAHWRLGRLYQSMGKKPEAQAEFEKARSLNQSASEDLIKVMGRAPHADNSTSEPNSQ